MKPSQLELQSCSVNNNNCHLQASDQLKESFWKDSVAGEASLGLIETILFPTFAIWSQSSPENYLPFCQVALNGLGLNFPLRTSSSLIFSPCTRGPGSVGVRQKTLKTTITNTPRITKWNISSPSLAGLFRPQSPTPPTEQTETYPSRSRHIMAYDADTYSGSITN